MKEKTTYKFFRISFSTLETSKWSIFIYSTHSLLCRGNKPKLVLVFCHIPWTCHFILGKIWWRSLCIFGVYTHWYQTWHSKWLLNSIPCTSSPMICTILHNVSNLCVSHHPKSLTCSDHWLHIEALPIMKVTILATISPTIGLFLAKAWSNYSSICSFSRIPEFRIINWKHNNESWWDTITEIPWKMSDTQLVNLQ